MELCNFGCQLSILLGNSCNSFLIYECVLTMVLVLACQKLLLQLAFPSQLDFLSLYSLDFVTPKPYLFSRTLCTFFILLNPLFSFLNLKSQIFIFLFQLADNLFVRLKLFDTCTKLLTNRCPFLCQKLTLFFYSSEHLFHLFSQKMRLFHEKFSF